MKKPPFLTLLAFFLLAMPAMSQEDENEWEDRFFMAFHSSTYLDFVKSPLWQENVWSGNRDVEGNKIYVDAPVQSSNVNIFSFGLEPRLNLREFDDNSALAISAPFAIGLGTTYPSDNRVLGIEGMGSFQLPLMAKLYLGSGSTYRSEKDFGFSVGAGIEYNKIGLIKLEQEGSTDTRNRGWVQPVASLSVHFWRGYNPVELNVKYGAGNVKEYDRDRFGNPLEDGNGNLTSVRTKANSFKISVSYLLNY